jgi:hypothetical protein
MIYRTHCELRLGDNLAGLHLVRKLAQAHPEDQFVHAANLDYYNQGKTLAEMVEDLKNVSIVDLRHRDSGSVDLWKGADGYFYNHPKWQHYVPFMLDFYALCCVRLGLPCPIKTVDDMLFDYPAIQKQGRFVGKFDWLVINSRPHSGQMPKFSYAAFEKLIEVMCKKYSVVVTEDTKGDYGQTFASTYSIHEIGNLSLNCDFILMVSTGPSWPTFNIWNKDSVKLRIVLLENERIEFGGNTVHCNSVEAAQELMIKAGAL